MEEGPRNQESNRKAKEYAETRLASNYGRLQHHIHECVAGKWTKKMIPSVQVRMKLPLEVEHYNTIALRTWRLSRKASPIKVGMKHPIFFVEI